MSKKIYGVTVGTTMSPKKLKEQLKPVLSVNGAKPDENGNVEIKIPEGGGTVTDEQLAEAVNDALAQAKASGEFDGKDGKDGQDGSPGKDGTSVTVKSVSESTADGGSNVVTFSDDKTLIVKNGKQGSDGKTPVRGVDYYTEADKAEIVAMVIESLGGNPVFGYVDENNNIIVSGNLPDGIYSVKYEVDNGSTIDIGELVLSESEPDEPDTPAYTNLADPTSADWQEGYRLSISSGGTAALAGHTATNFIPCKLGDVLRVKGLTITSRLGVDGAGSAKVVAYDNSKTKITGGYGLPTSGSDQHYALKVTKEGDVSTYTPLIMNDGTNYSTSAMAYIRLDGFLMDGYTKNDVIITVNEEIV